MSFSSSDFEEWARAGKPEPKPNAAPQNPPSAAPVPPKMPDATGMPTFARLRLQEHVTNKPAPFTSNLSVNEFLLTRAAGYHPVAQVIGASVYRVGNEWFNGRLDTSAREVVYVTEARTEAWRLALERLAQQAELADADVIAGVRLAQSSFAVGRGKEKSAVFNEMLEVSLSGTAMRARSEAVRAQLLQRPTLTTLSGEDLYTLHTAGCVPCGIAYGCCVYYQTARWSVIQGNGAIVAPGTQWTNQLQDEYTLALHHAQKTAAERLRTAAELQGATGVLDVRYSTTLADTEREVRVYGQDEPRKIAGLVITVEIVGTAIRDVAGASWRPPSAARSILPLTDRTII